MIVPLKLNFIQAEYRRGQYRFPHVFWITLSRAWDSALMALSHWGERHRGQRAWCLKSKATHLSLVSLCLVSALGLSACGKEPLYHSQSYVFGTLVDVTLYGEPEEQARHVAQRIQQRFQAIHHQLHAWSPDSELSALNRQIALGQPATVSAALAQLLLDAQRFSAQSHDRFNPAIGGLIQAWGFHRDQFTPVTVSEATQQAWVAKQPSMNDLHIVFHHNQWTVTSRNAHVQLDLGGYAKGYALDEAMRILKAEHVHNALINIGGNVIALGQHGKRPWRVGVQDPRQPGPMATLDLHSGWAIGTSGDYQRYFLNAGQRYCHLIDPSTGAPAHGTQAVTVLIPPAPNAGTRSDVSSKPIFLGNTPQERANAAASMQVDLYLAIDAAGRRYVSKGMNKHLHWTHQG